MILISENKDYRYCAVAVPIDAKEFGIFKIFEFNSLVYKDNNDKPCILDLPEYCNPEILGVIRNESDGYFEDIPIPYFKRLCKEKGILIENPIPKPEQEKTWMATKFVTTIEFDRWQEYESKLVKAVIIKVKK